MKKALIVDDDPNISELLRLYFDKDGFAVVSCLDGDKAYETFLQSIAGCRHSRPDAARQGRLRHHAGDPQDIRCADPDADRTRRYARQGGRPRAGRRRLRPETVRTQGAAGPGQGGPAPLRGRPGTAAMPAARAKRAASMSSIPV